MYQLHLTCDGLDYIVKLEADSAEVAMRDAIENYLLEGQGQAGWWEFVKLEKVA